MMEEIWKRIDSWLQANIPDIYSDLLPRATEEETNSAEALMDICFPDEVKASYRIHNGQNGDSSGLFGEFELYSIENIKRRWKLLKELFDARGNLPPKQRL
jgi:cell wall assembly regulator SMI1